MPVEPTVMQISCHGGVLSTLAPCSLLPCCTSGISGCSKVPVQMRGLSGNQQQSRLGFSAGICFTPRFLSVRPVGQVSQRLPSSAPMDDYRQGKGFCLSIEEAFLEFLDQDIRQNPHHVKNVPQSLIAHARELTRGVEVDLDAPLDPDDE